MIVADDYLAGSMLYCVKEGDSKIFTIRLRKKGVI